MLPTTLFEKYSKNHSLIREKYLIDLPDGFEQSVVCPTCSMAFNSLAIDYKYLTIEHLPSESLGGKPLILTCAKCNNTAGYKLDKALLQYYQNKPFVTGVHNSAVEAILSLDDNKFTAGTTITLTNVEGKISLEFKNRINSERIEAYKRLLTENAGKQFAFHIRKPKPREVEIAILRIGYLLAFEKLGHVAIETDNHRNIRDQIMNPDENILPSFGVMLGSSLAINDQGLYVLRFDNGFKCTYVSFEVSLGGNRELVGVVLPPTRMNDLEFYQDHQNLIDVKTQTGFRGVKLDRQDYLHNPDCIDEIDKIYDAINSGKLK